MTHFPTFTLEMANNHGGDVDAGKHIIDEFAWAAQRYPGRVAFKFQYRNLDEYIHPRFAQRMDLKYIARFRSTELSEHSQKALQQHAAARGFVTMCTPFDEKSAALVAEHGYDVCKVASAALTDWPLLEEIAGLGLPVVASTAGSSLEDVARVAAFLANRGVPHAFLHCVALYPTAPTDMRLSRIRQLKEAFPGITIGFSTHEAPEDLETVKLAVASGAEMFEKHVGVAVAGPLNAYSADPDALRRWFDAYDLAHAAVGEADQSVLEAEAASLQQLRRGAWLRRDVAAGEQIRARDVFFAMPTEPGQLTANDFGKYVTVELAEPVKAGDALMAAAVAAKKSAEESIQQVASSVLELFAGAGVHVQREWELELSHHYGLEQFTRFGLGMVTLVNRDYCKKFLALLPAQEHPAQYHKVKEEFFSVLSGELFVELDGETTMLRPGQSIVVPRGTVHRMWTDTGAVWEEISSTHIPADSYYLDETINANAERKTKVRVGRLLTRGDGKGA